MGATATEGVTVREEEVREAATVKATMEVEVTVVMGKEVVVKEKGEEAEEAPRVRVAAEMVVKMDAGDMATVAAAMEEVMAVPVGR